MLRVAEITFGIALLYFRFFLYESEEGYLENALVNLWISIADRADNTRERLTKLLEESARISQRLFGRVFGAKLLSFQASAVSCAFAWTSVSALAVLLPANQNKRDVLLACAIGNSIAGIAPAMIQKSWAAIFPCITAAFMFLACGYALFSGQKIDNEALGIVLLLSIPVVPFIDIAWLVGCRLGSRWAMRHRGVIRHVVVILCGVMVGLGSLAFSLSGEAKMDFWRVAQAFGLPDLVGVFILSLALTRIFLAAVSLVQFSVLLVGFGNWIVWPLLSRLVYAAERFKVFKERKFFGTFGGALLLHASGGTNWLLSVIKTL